MAKKFKAGDIFSFQIPTGEYMAGRVMLDVKRQCVRSKLLESGSALSFYGSSILIEVYKQTFSNPTSERSDILIPGIWCDPGLIEKGLWKILEHQPIDPTQVDFPESFVQYGARTILFQRGELAIPIDMTYEEYKQLSIFGRVHGGGNLGEYCLYHLERKDEISVPDLVVDVELRNLKNTDLHFHEFRSEAYRRLGEDENQSYFEIALKHGHDLRRFYEIDKDKQKELELNPSPLEHLDGDDIILCPYCLSIVGEADKICHVCNEDMTHDSKHALTVEQYHNQKLTSCKFCGKSIMKLASLCPYCLKWEDGRDSEIPAQS
jgi:Immunity protein 26